MRTLLLVSLWCLAGWDVAWADWQAPPGLAYDITALHREVQAAGINLQGASCRDELGTAICQRVPEDFTQAERVTMDAVAAAHDPAGEAKRTARRKAARAAGDAKLKALGLTDEEIEARR